LIYSKGMLESVLRIAGLDQKEAQIYELILRYNKVNPAKILEKVPIKRGDLYNVLKRLENKRLIHPLPSEKKLTYVALSPDAIEESIKTKERTVEEAKAQLSSLFSLYNVGAGRPVFSFALGLDGIKEIFNDSLTTRTEILSYADVDGWMKHLKNYAVWYAAERRRKKIYERVIIPDTPMALKYMETYDLKVMAAKYIPHKKYKFALEMNIYDNKVTYVTLREPFVSILIEDQTVADTQRAIFEMNWASAGEHIGNTIGN
jgi:sugar-specific transcriptional regulator TrmB